MSISRNSSKWAIAKESDTTCSGTCLKSCSYVPANNMSLSLKLNNDIKKIEDYNVCVQAMAFCDIICQHLYNSESIELPPFYYANDDGDAFFEWIFNNFRFGFLFCKDDSESGWFLVSKTNGKMERFNAVFRGKETIDFIFDYIGKNA